MPAFDLLNFNWNITPAHHVGNGDPFRYLWYRKKVHEDDGTVTTLHTTVEVGVDGYYIGDFAPSLTLVQYSSARDGDGKALEDSIQLNVASSDDARDVATLDALFGETWRDFLSQVSHAAQEKHALAVSRGELAAQKQGAGDEEVTDLLAGALELSRNAASPEHDEYDDALGGLFGEFEDEPLDDFETLEKWAIDPNGGMVANPFADADAAAATDAAADAVGVSRRVDLADDADDGYGLFIEDTPTEVMHAVTPGDEDDDEDELPADLQAVLDKYGPDVLTRLLEK